MTTGAGPVGIRTLRALAAQDVMKDMTFRFDLLKSLGVDSNEMLAAQLKNGTLEAKIDVFR